MRISARYLEPLQDWVLLRNLLSISLRLGGTMRTMRSEAAENNLLVKSGFIKSERSALSSKLAIDAPGYIIPDVRDPPGALVGRYERELSPLRDRPYS